MMLKSFGCSFIFGTGLSDDISHQCHQFYDDESNAYICPSQLTWPALLANDIRYQYNSCALPGIGNLQIFENILKNVPNSKDELFVIQWTWIDRYDYVNQNRALGENFWNTIIPGNKTQLATTYYKYIHSQYGDKLTNLIYVKSAIDILQQNNIPFIMTYCDNLLFEIEWHTSPAIEYLQKYVQPYMTNFDGRTFLEWTKEKGFPISETLHPLEEAHQAAFELIKSYNLV